MVTRGYLSTLRRILYYLTISRDTQFIVNPKATQCVEHLRACHSRSPLETRAVIVLTDWPKFKALTKDLKLIKRLPKGEKVLMMTSLLGTYAPSDLLP